MNRLSEIDPDRLASRFVQSARAAGFIDNVVTSMEIVSLGDRLLPMSVNDGQFEGNSYVVSPISAYARYLRVELCKIDNRPLRLLFDAVVSLLGRGLERADLDRVVVVNNWLLSTNLHDYAFDEGDTSALTAMLVRRYPGHALMFRSLNRMTNQVMMDRLAALGYRMMPSRQVYFFDGRQGAGAPLLRHNNTIADRRLLARGDYRIEELDVWSEADLRRMADLYRLLYIDKYCHLNPRFTAAWIGAGLRDGWLKVIALRNGEGRLDGVIGLFEKGGVITAPLVGYDTSLPRRIGLYRRLTALCLECAVAERKLLNFSAGASHFKLLRGGLPCIEYSAVYVDHLAPGRRLTWRCLEWLLHGIGVPVMRLFKL